MPKRVVRDPTFEPLRRAQERDPTASEATDDFKNARRVITQSWLLDVVLRLLVLEAFFFIAASPLKKIQTDFSHSSELTRQEKQIAAIAVLIWYITQDRHSDKGSAKRIPPLHPKSRWVAATERTK